MSLHKSLFNQLIKNFDFKNLFIELGWNNFNKTKYIKAADESFTLQGIVEKKGFTVFVCNSNENSKLPTKDIRIKIDREITKLFHEHLLIYIDKNHTQQLWQLSIKEPNKPIQYREFQYYKSQEPEILFQKLRNLFFSIDEEDNITLLDVKLRVSEQFNQNAEKITKKFYAEFKRHHTEFQSFIEGLENQTDIDWYTSLMLNRLMFVYFIQKKGFLNGDTDYLSNKLKTVKEKKGKDKFYKSFYKTFLLTLFHQGLGKPDHTPELEEEIGKIPYLNGGLFDVHQLEKDNDKLNIKDEAFEKLFAFFNEYNWHLDVRPDATGKDINPDVIGYIFEKYINDRAAMGAYYTKEDITEYIAKNTIIPFLFDRVKEKVKNAFAPESSLWKMLKDDPDRYIYDAVKKGVPQNGGLFDDLPDEIKAGFLPDLENEIVKETTKPHLWEIRKVWNKKAPEKIALPTETYRELIERRKRYAEIKNKMLNGEITDINDFITYNLNIRQFAQDAIQQYKGSVFISEFYKAIKEITILDPTCGSGAFLFAALNILQPLYEACFDRMREFVNIDNEKGSGKKHELFRATLSEIKKHPNEKYYVFKNIILNNLYGVDIMNEAVEIAKLRLFLKLVAVVDPDDKDENYGLEPLPDIDFNIRAGNTLVGYVSESEIDKGVEVMDAFNEAEKDKVKANLKEKMEQVAMTFKRYKENQLDEEIADFETLKNAKDELRNRLAELNDSLNDYLAKDYGIIREKERDKYEQWLNSHKPFHWFAEYYEIINGNGGFDVIIGNPPYVEYNAKNTEYIIRKCVFEGKTNLYAIVMDRVRSFTSNNGSLGMIVLLSLTSTARMRPLLKRIIAFYPSVYFSHYEGTSNPGTMFQGVKAQLNITIGHKQGSHILATSHYFRVYAEERIHLFEKISYVSFPDNVLENFPKISAKILLKIFNQLFLNEYRYFFQPGRFLLFFRNMGNFFWKLAFTSEPTYRKNGVQIASSTVSSLSFSNEHERNAFICFINSSLFFVYWNVFSDCYHLSKKEITRLIPPTKFINSNLKKIVINLMTSYNENGYMQIENTRAGGVKEYYRYFPQYSKPIIDQIDTVLAEHYGFTEEELDFIINYDIKYRMGKELEAYIEGRLGK